MSPSDPRYRARRCGSCQLRFPVAEHSALGDRCPVCGAATEAIDEPYPTHGAPAASVAPTRLRVSALLDNIRSLRNVGSMFRTADGAGVEHLYLGGITPTPEHPKLGKTSLGAERSVSWSRHPDACALAAELRQQGRSLWALEGGPRSVSLFEPVVREAADELRVAGRTLIVVLGHEVSGVDPRIVDQCERVVHLPMMGWKDSLNVSVTLGIVAYWLRFSVAL